MKNFLLDLINPRNLRELIPAGVMLIILILLLAVCGVDKPCQPVETIVTLDSMFTAGDYFYFVSNGINGVDTLGYVRFMALADRDDGAIVMFFSGNPDSVVNNAQDLMIIKVDQQGGTDGLNAENIRQLN